MKNYVPKLKSKTTNPPKLNKNNNPPKLKSSISNPKRLKVTTDNPPKLKSELVNPPRIIRHGQRGDALKDYPVIEEKASKGAIFTFKVAKIKNHNYLKAYVSGWGTPKDKRHVDTIKLRTDNIKEEEKLKSRFNRTLSFHTGVESKIYNDYKPETKSIFIHRIGSKPRYVQPDGTLDHVQHVVTARVKVNGKYIDKVFQARSTKINNGGTRAEAVRHLRGQIFKEGLAVYTDDVVLTKVHYSYERFA